MMLIDKKVLTKLLSLGIGLILLSVSAAAYSQLPKTAALRSGTWRAALQRPDGQEIVFNFETKKERGKTLLFVINGSERLRVDTVIQKGDSIFIRMPFFASGFNAKLLPDGNLEGVYVKKYADREQTIPFTAEYGNKTRYAAARKALHDLSGIWAVRFAGDSEIETAAVGEFEQSANGRITGTFRTPTGDYRYLEGVVSGDSLQLSAFDGGHAIVFTGKVDSDSTISNAFLYSGPASKIAWSARKDSTADLPDSYQLTKLREGDSTLNFRFPSTDGDTISITDARFKNKVVIVQILGSWCPNCMDETAFLSKYYKENKSRGVEIVALAYERSEDIEAARKALQPFRKRFAVDYPFLLTGVSVSDEKRTEKTLPQLESIRAFPTTLFIGKDGRVRKIHTGFDGPGTGKHFEDYKKTFYSEISELLSEQHG